MRGTQIIEPPRDSACANCGHLRFLKYQEMTRFGRTGLHFCRIQYRDTGEFENQPWDYTCPDFEERRRKHDGNKRLQVEAVPIVEDPGVVP